MLFYRRFWTLTYFRPLKPKLSNLSCCLHNIATLPICMQNIVLQPFSMIIWLKNWSFFLQQNRHVLCKKTNTLFCTEDNIILAQTSFPPFSQFLGLLPSPAMNPVKRVWVGLVRIWTLGANVMRRMWQSAGRLGMKVVCRAIKAFPLGFESRLAATIHWKKINRRWLPFVLPISGWPNVEQDKLISLHVWRYF